MQRVYEHELDGEQAIDQLITFLQRMKRVLKWRTNKDKFVMEIWKDVRAGKEEAEGGDHDSILPDL